MSKVNVMNPAARRVRTLVLTLVALALATGSNAYAQRLSADLLKSGSTVRNAFRTVVADASRATVRVLVDDEQAALGTVVAADGYVLTKASQLHSEPIVVQLANGEKREARVVGLEREFDIALLKVDADRLPVVRWSEGSETSVGQWLATPGLNASPVAVGVVSVGAREIPGERGVLGIALADAKMSGAEITQIFPNSGADKAGLQVGDVIVQVAGTKVRDGAGLAELVQTFRPGETLDLRVIRNEEEFDARATLGTQFSNILDRAAFQNQLGGELSVRRVGFPSALQHDTVLRPEDCGGVIVDLSGRAVGLNIARAGRTETFAIPAAKLLPLIEELKSGRLAPSQVVRSETASAGE